MSNGKGSRGRSGKRMAAPLGVPHLTNPFGEDVIDDSQERLRGQIRKTTTEDSWPLKDVTQLTCETARLRDTAHHWKMNYDALRERMQGLLADRTVQEEDHARAIAEKVEAERLLERVRKERNGLRGGWGKTEERLKLESRAKDEEIASLRRDTSVLRRQRDETLAEWNVWKKEAEKWRWERSEVQEHVAQLEEEVTTYRSQFPYIQSELEDLRRTSRVGVKAHSYERVYLRGELYEARQQLAEMKERNQALEKDLEAAELMLGEAEDATIDVVDGEDSEWEEEVEQIVEGEPDDRHPKTECVVDLTNHVKVNGQPQLCPNTGQVTVMKYWYHPDSNEVSAKSITIVSAPISLKRNADAFAVGSLKRMKL